MMNFITNPMQSCVQCEVGDGILNHVLFANGGTGPKFELWMFFSGSVK